MVGWGLRNDFKWGGIPSPKNLLHFLAYNKRWWLPHIIKFYNNTSECFNMVHTFKTESIFPNLKNPV